MDLRTYEKKSKKSLLPAEELNVFFSVILGQLLLCCSSGEKDIHGILHPVGENDLVGEGQPPWLHRVSLTEMLLFHRRIGVIGNLVALGLFDPVLENSMLDLFVEGKG